MNDKSNYSQFYIIRTLKNVCHTYDAVLNKFFAPLGLTVMQCEVLNYLFHKPEGTARTDDLLYIFKVSPSSLSSVLSALKKKEYIQYKNVGRDLRTKHIFLTDKAVGEEERIQENMSALYTKIFADIDEEHFGIFQSVAGKLQNNLAKQL